jgi:hypothetical protein
MDLSKDNSDSVCSRKQTGCIKEGFDQMSPAHAKHLKPVARLLLEPGRNRLNCWKEIAVYLAREVRTVQRWEKREGLPVRRHFHSKASSVYAFKNEVDAWLHSRRRTFSLATLGSRETIGNPGVTRFSNNLEDEMKRRALGASGRQSATFSVDSSLSFLVAWRISKCLYCAARRESLCSTRNPATPLLY